MYRRPTNFGNIIVMRSETLAQSKETLHSGGEDLFLILNAKDLFLME